MKSEPVDRSTINPIPRGTRSSGQTSGLFGIAASAADAFGIMTIADRFAGPRGCLLTFHRVARSNDWITLPNRDFYIDLGFLDRLLTYLKDAHWDIVTMDEVVRRLECGATERPFVNFSIDDVYRDTWELAVPLFRRHGVPVTLYVTTGIPDGNHVMWTSGLESVILEQDWVAVSSPAGWCWIDTRTCEAKRRAYSHVSSMWEACDPIEQYRAFCTMNDRSPEKLHERHAVDWTMLSRLRDDPCVEIGSHTVTHPRISTLPADRALTEMTESRHRLEDRLGGAVKHFAFPYGRQKDCGPRDFALAHKSGYATAATTRKGLVRFSEPGSRFALPRNTINGANQRIAEVQILLTGMGGTAARLLNRI
jgi:peptidoglycan/xylan/chitin deacetylase (PgdA/CDA1 family)